MKHDTRIELFTCLIWVTLTGAFCLATRFLGGSTQDYFLAAILYYVIKERCERVEEMKRKNEE
jgi:hypothetical protein